MTIDNTNKWQIRAATLGIFLLGFLAGALALNAYHVWISNAPNHSSRGARYERIFNELGLNEAQKTEIKIITDETREQLQRVNKESEPRVKEIRGRADERLQKVLTPEQWQRFQQLRDELRQSNKRKREKHN